MSIELALQAFEHAERVYLHADLRTALDELTKAERLARAGGYDGLLVGILVARTSGLRELGQADERRMVLAEIDRLLPCLKDDERSLALTHLRMEQGIDARRAGDFVAAEKLLREAEAEARSHRWGIAVILANLGSVYLSGGRLEDARTKLQEAIEIDRQHHDQRALASDLNILALTYDVSGDHVTAGLYFGEALEIAMQGDFVKEAADALSNSVLYLEEAKRFDEAKAGYELALRLYEQIGDQVAVVNVKSSLGILASRSEGITKRHDRC